MVLGLLQVLFVFFCLEENGRGPRMGGLVKYQPTTPEQFLLYHFYIPYCLKTFEIWKDKGAED